MTGVLDADVKTGLLDVAGVKVKDFDDVKQMIFVAVVAEVAEDPEAVLTKNLGVFKALLTGLESSSSSSVYPDPDSGVNVKGGNDNFLSLFCSSAKLRMILAMSDRLLRITSEGNHLRKFLMGNSKS